MVAWESVEKQLVEVKNHSLTSVLQAVGTLRSLRYFAELLPLSVLRHWQRKKWRGLKVEDRRRLQQVLREVLLLIRQDSERMVAGLYPLSVLKPELGVSPLVGWLQLWYRAYQLALKGDSHNNSSELDAENFEALRDVPSYYREHFKYAGTSFLDPNVASLYEHQMELLFLGSMDAMRRLLLAPMKNAFRFSEGEGLRFLEIGCGSGRMTRFVKLAFPKAKIVTLDASPAFLKEAQQRLSEFSRIDFIQGDALDLPFKDQRFDAVYLSFLLHEIPLEIRRQVLAEAYRVLNHRGWLGVVDLLQFDDVRELNWTLEESWLFGQKPVLDDYTQNGLVGALQHLGLRDVGSERGFLAKAVFGHKE